MNARIGAVLAATILLAGCETAPTPEEIQAFNTAACDEAGFEPRSDAHRLCLLLQDTNRRIEALQRRITFLELDVRSAAFPLGRCIDRRC